MQNPHWSAFSMRKACCSAAMAPLSDSPSMVSTRHPSAWAASIRQPRIGSPSTRTVQAPQHPVLAADVRAGQPEIVPQEVDQALARLDLPRDRARR